MEKEIKKIVLTGGPCAGKTTAMSWINENFTKQGYKVLFVPEEATELIKGGITPWENPAREFQSLLISMQIKKEDAFIKACEFLSGDKFLIVYDRGILDSRAYMGEEEFYKSLADNDLTLENVFDRYDAVFHLVSSAKGEDNAYQNTDVRKETKEDAIALDERTLNAWVGHPHLRIIDNEHEFQDKMKNLMREISSSLGIPYPYEIERKYLIKKPSLELLNNLPHVKKVHIVQTYLKSMDGNELRVRQRGNNGSYSYTLTKKVTLNNMKRIEIERRLTQSEYIECLVNADPNKKVIIKDRYCLCYQNQYFEIDIYPDMENEAICEIELSDENQEIKIPEYLQVIEEVTDKEEYKNTNLALIRSIYKK